MSCGQALHAPLAIILIVLAAFGGGGRGGAGWHTELVADSHSHVRALHPEAIRQQPHASLLQRAQTYRGKAKLVPVAFWDESAAETFAMTRALEGPIAKPLPDGGDFHEFGLGFAGSSGLASALEHFTVCVGLARGDACTCASSVGRCSTPSNSALIDGLECISAGATPRQLESSEVRVKMLIQTLATEDAGTSDGATFSFEVAGVWAPDAVLMNSSSPREMIVKDVELPAWPSRLRVGSRGADAWGYSSIALAWQGVAIDVLGDEDGLQLVRGTRHWVGDGGQSPPSQVYEVPT